MIVSLSIPVDIKEYEKIEPYSILLEYPHLQHRLESSIKKEKEPLEVTSRNS